MVKIAAQKVFLATRGNMVRVFRTRKSVRRKITKVNAKGGGKGTAPGKPSGPEWRVESVFSVSPARMAKAFSQGWLAACKSAQREGPDAAGRAAAEHLCARGTSTTTCTITRIPTPLERAKIREQTLDRAAQGKHLESAARRLLVRALQTPVTVHENAVARVGKRKGQQKKRRVYLEK